MYTGNKQEPNNYSNSLIEHIKYNYVCEHALNVISILTCTLLVKSCTRVNA